MSALAAVRIKNIFAIIFYDKNMTGPVFITLFDSLAISQYLKTY